MTLLLPYGGHACFIGELVSGMGIRFCSALLGGKLDDFPMPDKRGIPPRWCFRGDEGPLVCLICIVELGSLALASARSGSSAMNNATASVRSWLWSWKRGGDGS